MNIKASSFIIAVVLIAFGAFLAYAYVLNDFGKSDGTVVPFPSPRNGVLIPFTHSYLPKSAGVGEHRFRGVMQLSTPCHQLQTQVSIAESYPEQIQIYFQIIPSQDICVQAIDPRPFEVNVFASRNARLGLVTINGEPVQFSVQEETARVPNPPRTAIVFGEPFTLAFGTEKKRSDLSIRFTGVRTDSRCPENADCVWAGEAVLEFQIWNPSAPEDVVEEILLNFPGEESQTVSGVRSYATFGAYGIHLVGVTSRLADRAPQEEAYQATLVVNPAD